MPVPLDETDQGTVDDQLIIQLAHSIANVQAAMRLCLTSFPQSKC
jgi:hypothetical protein